MGESAAVVRIKIDLSYDGTEFSGWAAQPDRRTVEGVLAETLGRVLRLGEPPRLTVAGRTDAGVHARGQVAHADLPQDVWAAGAGAVLRRLARALPPDIRVRGIEPAPRASTPGFPRSGGATPTGSATIPPRRTRYAGTTPSGTRADSTWPP